MMRVLIVLFAVTTAQLAEGTTLLDELIVTSTRVPSSLADHIGNVAVLNDDAVANAAHVHIHELMTQVAGVWISRGSGQENLPSVRSPVLTGAGSCGAFLTLEDGVPSRPNGFCNVNQLFELPTELAQGIEVIRGPGNALYGSNGLHGTINVLTPAIRETDQAGFGVDVGPNDFYRARASINDRESVWLGSAIYTNDGGFRDASGYQQSKLVFKKGWSQSASNSSLLVSISDLNQETAGFILGEDAYKDESLSRQNPNPEAYRDADSQRLHWIWQNDHGDYAVDFRPYLRRSSMEFLQHFLPGQPVEENGHLSAGALSQWRINSDSVDLTLGFDFDYADVYLRETQFGPTIGSPFLVETRPQGKHYDYDVNSINVAGYGQWQWQWSSNVAITAGARVEYTRYDYENNMLTGNTRDDGTPCGFGGCLYTRPDDRTDDFIDVAPNVGLRFQATTTSQLYTNLSRGFRAPQMTELYRLQSGQQVSDLDSESIDSFELGWRYETQRIELDASTFLLRKRDSVYRDANGFNVSGGRSKHIGVEFLADIALSDVWRLTLNGTYAEHTYDFDAVAARGTAFVSGRDVDTAPLWQGSAELNFNPSERWSASAQWISLGAYYLDPENVHQYPGHDVGNVQLSYSVSSRVTVSARIRNVTDRRFADRADFAFGNYRYFPGRPRELYLRVEAHL